MGDLFGSYSPGEAWDEMFDVEGGDPRSRPHYEALHDVLSTLSKDDYTERCKARDRSFRDQGITFSLSGEQRPFPLDLVPRVIPSEEWAVIEAGGASCVMLRATIASSRATCAHRRGSRMS